MQKLPHKKVATKKIMKSESVSLQPLSESLSMESGESEHEPSSPARSQSESSFSANNEGSDSSQGQNRFTPRGRTVESIQSDESHQQGRSTTLWQEYKNEIPSHLRRRYPTVLGYNRPRAMKKDVEKLEMAEKQLKSLLAQIKRNPQRSQIQYASLKEKLHAQLKMCGKELNMRRRKMITVMQELKDKLEQRAKLNNHHHKEISNDRVSSELQDIEAIEEELASNKGPIKIRNTLKIENLVNQNSGPHDDKTWETNSHTLPFNRHQPQA